MIYLVWLLVININKRDYYVQILVGHDSSILCGYPLTQDIWVLDGYKIWLTLWTRYLVANGHPKPKRLLLCLIWILLLVSHGILKVIERVLKTFSMYLTTLSMLAISIWSDLVSRISSMYVICCLTWRNIVMMWWVWRDKSAKFSSLQVVKIMVEEVIN